MRKKKILFLNLFIVFSFLVLTYFKNSPKIKNSNPNEFDRKDKKRSLKKSEDTDYEDTEIQKKTSSSEKLMDSGLNKNELKEINKRISSVELGWKKRIQKVFIDELSLKGTDIEDYYLMRSKYEEDRLEAFEDFHEKKIYEKGGSYKFPATEEESHIENKIRKEYLNAFRRRFGDDAFVKYYNALERYNESIRQSSSTKDDFLNVDF